MRFGKHPPKIDYRTLRFRDYLTRDLGPPPASRDILAKIGAKLGPVPASTLFPMDGNDTYGDCTIAALAHAITAYRGVTGREYVPSNQVIEKLYFHLTGGVDSGLNEADVLNYWRQHAVSHDKILAYVSIDPKNHAHIQQAVNLFNGVYLGFQVQQNAIADFNAHRAWTPGKLTKDGHAVYAVGYDKDGVTVLTWGNTQKGTWAWWDECVDEAYAILPPEAKDPAFAPGFNITQLESDLQAVAS